MNKRFSTLFALLVCSSLVFASEPVATPSFFFSERPAQWGTLISKENNLYKITDKLYRSKQLSKKELPLINDLKIKTIVNLRPSTRDKKEFSHTDIFLADVPIRTWAIKDRQIAEALWQIEKGQRNGNVLLHCYHGSDRTGLIIGMYRIIYQNWTIENAYQEMRQGGYGFNTMWTNIEPIFSPSHVANIKEILAQKRQQEKN